jgi:membrane-bound serine protease (ClpP class)
MSQGEWTLVIIIIVLAVAAIVYIVFRIIDSYRPQVTTGKEDLAGKSAVVREELNPEGTVFYQGDLWTAISVSGKIDPGEEVIISKVEGLKLIVAKKAKE